MRAGSSTRVIVVTILVLATPWWRGAVVVAGTIAFGFVVHELAEQLRPSLVEGTTFGEARIDGFVDSWVLLPVDIVTPGRAARRARSRASPTSGSSPLSSAYARPQPALAMRRAHPGAVPRCVRLGEPARRPARGRALHPHRRDARRAHGLSAPGPPRQAAGGDRMSTAASPCSRCRSLSLAFGGLTCLDRPRPRRGRGRDRQRHRAERRGQDDALQRDHGRLPPRRGRHRLRRASRSSASTRTGSRDAASRARSRRSACS